MASSILRFDPKRRVSSADPDRQAGRPPVSPFARRVLDERQLAHRRRMLDHLQSREAAAS
jgi:hypothetical protein